MTLTEHLRRSLGDELRYSLAVLTRPSVRTFELFERKGGVEDALLYVLLASLVSALLAAFFALMPWHPQVTAWSQFIDRLVGIPVQFGIFTGVVYWVARQFFGGTGRYAEVAYTFALFFVPLSLISTLVGWIPVVGWLLSLLISLAQIYFAYIAVQSSMNIREGAQPLLTLVVAAILTSALNWAVFGQWWLN